MAVPCVLWGFDRGAWINEFGLKCWGNGSAGEYDDWRSGGGLRGDVCGVRADKIGDLARGWSLAVDSPARAVGVRTIVGQR